MAGIYIHIPFCAKKCFYCDFYVSLSFQHKENFLSALKKEIKLRKNYLDDEQIETIYFGGGTPSLLNEKEITDLTDYILKYHHVNATAEITLEANPDDLTTQYLRTLKQTHINRLSIGIQSFFDDDLIMMNRRHKSEESKKAVLNAQDAGFINLSGDLIYGLPGMTTKKWEKNLEEFYKLSLKHLSAYHLTYEPKTVFKNYLDKGKISEISEEESVEQFRTLRESAKNNGYIHYETSNFAQQDYFSKHNSAYWKQQKYLGLGPSAHSYDLKSRQSNIANLKEYLKRIESNEHYFEKEVLKPSEKYNDYIITTMRTIWGTDLNEIKKSYGIQFYNHLITKSKGLIKDQFIIKSNEILTLSEKGKFIEDRIIQELMYLD